MPATLDAMPVLLVPERLRKVEPVAIQRYTRALEQFIEPEESQLETRSDNSIRQHPSSDVEGYFEWVTRHGKPAIAWSIVRPAFMWKLRFVMDEMLRLEKLRLKEGETLNFEENSPLKSCYDFILAKAAEFDAAPFTWQRICELLHTPSRHYKKAEKFLRALDKTINVVTTITENGQRLTGAEWTMPCEPMHGKIEQSFFGRVDEVDGEGDLFDKSKFNPVTVYPSSLGGPAGDEQAEPLDMTKRVKADEEGAGTQTEKRVNTEEESPEKPDTKRVKVDEEGAEKMEDEGVKKEEQEGEGEEKKEEPKTEPMDTGV